MHENDENVKIYIPGNSSVYDNMADEYSETDEVRLYPSVSEQTL